LSRSPEKRRITFVFLCVNIGAMLKEKFDGMNIFETGGLMKRRDAGIGGGIDIGPIIHQHTELRWVVVQDNGFMKRSKTPIVASIDRDS